MSKKKYFKKNSDSALRKTDIICCGNLEKMNLGWMTLNDSNKFIPYIKGHSDNIIYRVIFCPSCGKYVRMLL